MRTAAETLDTEEVGITGFRLAIAESMIPLEVHSENGDDFSGRISTTRLPNSVLTQVRARQHAVERTAELIERTESQFLKFHFQRSGRSHLFQDGREVSIRPGDVVLYDTRRPYTLAFTGTANSLVLMFPTTSLDLSPGAIAQVTAASLPSGNPLVSIFSGYFADLGEAAQHLDPAVTSRLVDSMLDVATTMLDSLVIGAAAPRTPNDRSFQRIVDHVDSQLSDPELSVTVTAAALFISVRQVQHLFRMRGTTYSTWLRTRRLERVRRDLANPAMGDVPIRTLIHRWGFSSPEHFSRAFRQHYGMTAQGYRTLHC